jgi:hypothetical protein
VSFYLAISLKRNFWRLFGSEPLDSYFKERVTQDVWRRVTACFVALSNDGRIAGYYTLASTSVFIGDLPAKLIKKLPRYPSVPVVRLERLAVIFLIQLCLNCQYMWLSNYWLT